MTTLPERLQCTVAANGGARCSVECCYPVTCTGSPCVSAPEYLANVEADPRRAAALQRARERAADGVTTDGKGQS